MDASVAEQAACLHINGFAMVDLLWNDRDKMQDVTEMIISNISTAYNENIPEYIYFMVQYIMDWDLTYNLFSSCEMRC